VFAVALPVILVCRYVAFLALGLYQGIWRYAGSREAAAIVAGSASRRRSRSDRRDLDSARRASRRSIFVLDALLCMVVIGISRFGERALCPREGDDPARRPPHADRRRRPSGRSLLRELRETRASGWSVRGRRPAPDPPPPARHAGPRRTLDIERILAADARPTPCSSRSRRPRPTRSTPSSAPAQAAGIRLPFRARETDLDPVVVLGTVNHS
jgi:hypothetical protein